MVHQPQLCLQQGQTPSLLPGLCLLEHPCCQQCLCCCPQTFPDTAVSCAMCLWAEEVDIPVDIARQAILYVYANFASELSLHPSAGCTCCPSRCRSSWSQQSEQSLVMHPYCVFRRTVRQPRSRSSLRQHCGRQDRKGDIACPAWGLARACKWVSIMLQNTSATAAFNGWQSASFPEGLGVQQGHCHPSCMSWQPNLWPVNSGTKPSKVSSGHLPCQMVSQMVSSLLTV